MTAQEVIQQTEHKMGVTVEKLREDFTRIRTGRASTGLLDKIKVDYYRMPDPDQPGCSGGRRRRAHAYRPALGKEHGEGR